MLQKKILIAASIDEETNQKVEFLMAKLGISSASGLIRFAIIDLYNRKNGE